MFANHRLSRRLVALCALLLALALPAFAQAVAAKDPKSAPPDAVLKMGSLPISGEEYGRWLLRVYGENYARDYTFDVFMREREAKRLGVQVTPQQAEQLHDQQMQARIAAAFHGSKDEWLEELRESGRTEDGVRAQRSTELLSDLLGVEITKVGRVIPEDYVRQRWELLYGRKGLKHDLLMLHVHLVFPTPAYGSERGLLEQIRAQVLEDGKQKILALRQRILDGEDFSELARKVSDDPDSRANGGLVKDFSHYGWAPEFLDAVDKVPLGTVSEPLYWKGGWWLVKRLATRETPLARVRDEIVADMTARGPELLGYEVGQRMEELFSKVKIQLSPDMLSDDKQAELPADAPAFTVDGEPVKRGTYALWLMRKFGETSINTFVEHKLVEEKAKALGLEATPEEIAQRQEEWIDLMAGGKFHGDRNRWADFLAESGRTPESFAYTMGVRARIDLLCEKLIKHERTVSEERVHARWEELYGPGGRSYEARVIVIAPPLAAPAEDATAEELAKRAAADAESARKLALDIVRRVRNGEDFGTLATRYSAEPETAKRGGALPGSRFVEEQWPESTVKVARELPPGECSDPLPLGNGWLILERGPDRTVPLEDVHDEIKKQLEGSRPSDGDCAFYRNGLLKDFLKEGSLEILPAMNH